MERNCACIYATLTSKLSVKWFRVFCRGRKWEIAFRCEKSCCSVLPINTLWPFIDTELGILRQKCIDNRTAGNMLSTPKLDWMYAAVWPPPHLPNYCKCTVYIRGFGCTPVKTTCMSGRKASTPYTHIVNKLEMHGANTDCYPKYTHLWVVLT